jgi:hypothetical protein
VTPIRRGLMGIHRVRRMHDLLRVTRWRLSVSVWIIMRRVVRRRWRPVSMIMPIRIRAIIRGPDDWMVVGMISNRRRRRLVPRQGRQWMRKIHFIEVGLSFYIRYHLSLIGLGSLHHAS